MLFLLPLVSWYYLQSGLKWRQQAQAIMNGTELFPDGSWKDLSGKTFTSDQLAEHVTIVSLVSCENVDSVSSTLDSLYKQFIKTKNKNANFIILNTCRNLPNAFVDSLKTGWFVFSCGDSTSLCDLLKVNWPAGKTHALVDRRKTIRHYYGESSLEDKRILNEHMVLLLPTERSDQIILKRGSKND